MLRERLIAGGPRCFQFAVYVGEPRAASAAVASAHGRPSDSP